MHRRHINHIAILAAAMFGVIFVVDLSLPLGVAGAVPYVAVVLLGWWFGSPRAIFLLAAIATILTILGYFYSAAGGVPWVVLTNRGLALFAIWIAAILVATAKRLSVKLDATEHRQSELLNMRFGRIIEHSVHEIYVFNARTMKFVQANRGAKENLGYTADELCAMSPTDLMREFSRESFEKLVKPLRQGLKDRLFFETPCRRKDGSTYPAEIHLQLISSEEPPVFLCSAQDITERLRMEERLRQAQKMEALGRLAGGVAHEFNNLLLPIVTLTEASLEVLDDASRVAKNLRTVLSAAKKGRSLIAKIMGFSRQQPSDRRAVVLHEVIAEAITVMGAALPSGIKIKSRLETFDETVFVDPAEIHQVVLNLGANAVNAIGSADGEIEIALRRTTLDGAESRKLSRLKPGVHALLTVRDTGCGMDSEVKARIFDPFFTTRPGGQGTGMGLSIVHTIIQGHDAAISVRSEVGKGTTFEIYLPLKEPPQYEGKQVFDGTAYPEEGPGAAKSGREQYGRRRHSPGDSPGDTETRSGAKPPTK